MALFACKVGGSEGDVDITALFPYTCHMSMVYGGGDNVWVTGGSSGWKIPCMGIKHMKIEVTNNLMNQPTITSDTGVTLSAGNNVDVSDYDYISVGLGGGIQTGTASITVKFSIVD